ncbi:MAG: hypothetical protein M3336_06080 [Chloroflexota bacterium]|nr:hypothetical protein [Chloroflexota bacterium]
MPDPSPLAGLSPGAHARESAEDGGSAAHARFHPDLAGAAARDFEAGSYLQDFLVATVVSILLTRLFLGMTGFPRVGGGGLHIAHMLWGGLLMLVALVLLLAVLGKRTKRLAAVIGGVGFGLFVDELGKFITADNDYFFQPTIALIYSLLVLLFLVFRAIERRSLSADELLANAADMLREVVMGGATQAEIGRTLALLERSKVEGPLVEGLRAAVQGAVRAREGRPPRIARAAARAWRLYDDLLAWRWFQRFILVLLVGQALLGVTVVLALLVVGMMLLLPSSPDWLAMPDPGAIAMQVANSPTGPVGATASALSALLSLVFAMLGAAQLRRSRLGAYRWLQRSVLVSVLVGQVPLFWEQQLGAVVQLAWNLLLLAALRYAIRQEEARVGLRALQRHPLD